MAARVVHFEIHVEDPRRAIAFYSEIFGWKFTHMPAGQDYWLIDTGPADEPGINGGMVRRPSPINGDSVIAYVCTLSVDSVDAATEAIMAHGGVVALPKMPIPGVGWLAYAKDPEGNVFGYMQSDPDAK